MNRADTGFAERRAAADQVTDDWLGVMARE